MGNSKYLIMALSVFITITISGCSSKIKELSYIEKSNPSLYESVDDLYISIDKNTENYSKFRKIFLNEIVANNKMQKTSVEKLTLCTKTIYKMPALVSSNYKEPTPIQAIDSVANCMGVGSEVWSFPFLTKFQNSLNFKLSNNIFSYVDMDSAYFTTYIFSVPTVRLGNRYYNNFIGVNVGIIEDNNMAYLFSGHHYRLSAYKSVDGYETYTYVSKSKRYMVELFVQKLVDNHIAFKVSGSNYGFILNKNNQIRMIPLLFGIPPIHSGFSSSDLIKEYKP